MTGDGPRPDGCGELAGLEDSAPRELRRGYHDRIALVRRLSLDVLSAAVAAATDGTAALVGRDRSAAGRRGPVAADAAILAAEVDAEVISLFALESPVARDLRLILAARDVTQISLLCVGLGVTLGERAVSSGGVLGPAVASLVAEVGSATGGLLRLAETAWSSLDAQAAGGVEAALVDVRLLQTDFFGSLLAMRDVPMDAALNLGLVARAYERLADHAEEIAGKVRFALEGIPAPAPPV